MRFYSNKKEIEKYFNSERVNQTLLKDIAVKGPFGLFRKYKQSRALLIGSIIDMALTTETNIYEEYTLYTPNIAPKELEIFQYLSNKNLAYNEIKDKDLIEAFNVTNYYKNYKTDTKLNKIRPILKKEYSAFLSNKKKSTITKNDLETVTNILAELSSIKVFQELFDPKDTKDTFYLYQLPIYFTKFKTPLKALLDLLIVRKENNKITEITIVDLKTMEGNVSNFWQKVKKFGYLFQLAFYKMAVLEMIKKWEEYEIDINNIKIHYKFAVVSSTIPGNAVVYTVPEKLIEEAYNGREETDKTPKKYSIPELIKLYKYYKSKNLKVNKEIYENGYETELKIYD